MSDSTSHRVTIEPLRGADNFPAGASTALAAVDKSTAKCYTCGRIGHFASDHGKQVNRGKEEKGKQEDEGKEKKKDERGGNRWKKGRGKNFRANVAQDQDQDQSDDEDFMFLARDPSLAQSLQPNDWILDSGCSRSIAGSQVTTRSTVPSILPAHSPAEIQATFSVGSTAHIRSRIVFTLHRVIDLDALDQVSLNPEI
ncbi:hypothetical protein R3P38DRAFT_3362706 [Favolaschia claudopus]|uniref:CCHC-type domain-containing protein n=1 Tax=Favolaschia claudopus TaxID=2862362 RepID=A0AAW0AL41_9AGAR